MSATFSETNAVFSQWTFEDALKIYSFVRENRVRDIDYENAECILVVLKSTLPCTTLRTIEIRRYFKCELRTQVKSYDDDDDDIEVFENEPWIREKAVRFIERCGYDEGFTDDYHGDYEGSRPDYIKKSKGFKIVVPFQPELFKILNVVC
jgi:hypothetical protein